MGDTFRVHREQYMHTLLLDTLYIKLIHFQKRGPRIAFHKKYISFIVLAATERRERFSFSRMLHWVP